MTTFVIEYNRKTRVSHISEFSGIDGQAKGIRRRVEL